MLGHRSASDCLHAFRQAQEFALEMVEGIFSVIQRSPVGERIVVAGVHKLSAGEKIKAVDQLPKAPLVP